MIVSLALFGGSAAIALACVLSRLNRHKPVCDLRRTIVIVGPHQNHPACVEQRRALRPKLMSIRAAKVNVVEVYSFAKPRRNGMEIEWADNIGLREVLRAAEGFHFLCLDDAGALVMRVRRPVSSTMISELIEEHQVTPALLPAPEVKADETEAASAPAAPVAPHLAQHLRVVPTAPEATSPERPEPKPAVAPPAAAAPEPRVRPTLDAFPMPAPSLPSAARATNAWSVGVLR